MLETLLNSNIENTTLDVGSTLFLIAISFLLGFMISLTYLKTNKDYHSQNFVTTLILLPVLMSTIVLLIGNNIAGAFSLAGIFSIIRFRSAPGNTKDIVYILFCVGAGLACGIKVPMYGILFTTIVCISLAILDSLHFGRHSSRRMKLTILVPEDMNNEHTFDDILSRYTKNYHLYKMRTKDFGSVYELTYYILILENCAKNEMIDDLRCRNGNLNISLSVLAQSEEF
ncbi:DUF4956 domain-containing protein [Breznakia sp. OttesenSCG-928-G09]|nr:DUF4956 domain-containing protein [Breznakia sp. OttesenSCG-928-G09]